MYVLLLVLYVQTNLQVAIHSTRFTTEIEGGLFDTKGACEYRGVLNSGPTVLSLVGYSYAWFDYECVYIPLKNNSIFYKAN